MELSILKLVMNNPMIMRMIKNQLEEAEKRQDFSCLQNEVWKSLQHKQGSRNTDLELRH